MTQIFKLSQCVATCGVNDWMAEADSRRQAVMDCLSRHAEGDWGECCTEDAQTNNEAVKNEDRLLSVFNVDGEVLWIITEWDRSLTTVLFPSEY